MESIQSQTVNAYFDMSALATLEKKPVSQTTHARVSVVIPCWGDEALLRQNLQRWSDFPGVYEIIVATASPMPLPDQYLPDKVLLLIAPQPNRGLQMNLGADSASGDWLLFHHADSELTADHLEAVASLGDNQQIVGGAFHRAFDQRHPAFRWVQTIERWRNRHFGSLFGDQSIFVRTAHFRELNGYRAYPLMEDMEFSKRLRKSGRIVLLDPPMRSSPRRHLKNGSWKTTLQNACFILLYHLGVSPVTLHRWYYASKN